MHGEEGGEEGRTEKRGRVGGRKLICCALVWTMVAAFLTTPFFFFLMCMGEEGTWEGESLI